MKHKHNLNHYRIMSGRFGELLPVSLIECLPGDMFRMQSSALLRLSPLNTPVMHPIHLRLHAFFVPNRLVWDEWEDFITDMNTTLTVPTHGGVNQHGSIMDYLGVPLGDYTQNPLNALPQRGYNMIWNEYYRDQDIDQEAPLTNPDIMRVRWGKDYFTTARAEAQSGATETVQIEFDQDVPVIGLGVSHPSSNPGPFDVYDSTGESARYTNAKEAGDGNVYVQMSAHTDGNPMLRIKAGQVGGVMDINEWRRAMAWQRLAEHRNKYGSRYTDYLNFLGVSSADQRLQRPEYIGGGSSTVQISEVLSTADTLSDSGNDGSPVGSLSGHGIAGHRTRPMRYFCQEHGHIHILASIRPKTVYESAVARNFYRQKPADYWQKEMEIMGDQPVLRGELRGNSSDPRSIFGYVDRHRDYREMHSGVAGEMRDILDNWHLARDFTGDPQLNSSFLECEPTERIFAESISDTFQLMVDHKVTARRLVSKRARI